MDVTELLRDVASRGVELWVEGARLRFRAPPGSLGNAHRDALKTQRSEVIGALRAAAQERVTVSPLSHNQRALWFIHQEAPDSTAYHVGFAARIGGALNRTAMRDALQAVSDRHDMLRTTYVVAADGQLQMETRGAVSVPLALIDVADLSDAELDGVIDIEYTRPFDLESGPVFRSALFSRSASEHILLICVHHIACDGWSLVLILNELFALYADATGAAPQTLPRAERTYSDFVEWQSQLLAGTEGARLAEMWQTTLVAPRAEIEVPPDRPRGSRKSYRGAAHRFSLTAEQVVRLRQFARDQGTTLFVVLLAAYKAMLFRLTGTEDVIVGTSTLGRSQADFTQIVGHFVNPVPLRTAVTSDLTFRALLHRVSQTVRSGLTGQDYPLSLMVQHAHVVRDASRSPLFEAFFGLLAFDKARDGAAAAGSMASVPSDGGGLVIEPLTLHQQLGQFELSLQFAERDGGLDAALIYCTELYEDDTIARMGAHYMMLLDGALLNAEQTLDQLPPRTHRLGGEPDAGSADAVSPALQELFNELASRDVRVSLDGEKLKVNAPVGALDDALKSRMAQAKTELIAALRRPAVARSGLRRIPHAAVLPISYAQQRLWFLDQMEPGNAHYNIAIPIHITGPLNADAMVRAVEALLQRHEVLRTRITEVDGNPRAQLMDSARGTVRLADISHLPAESRLREAKRLAMLHGQVPFDLAVGPMMQSLLVRISDTEHLLALCMHHIAADGWSLGVAIKEVSVVYEAFAAGLPSPLPPLELQYSDFAAWQRQQMSSGLLVRQLAFWQRELADAPALLELPTDRPRPAVQTYRGNRRKHRVDAALLADLKVFSRANDATLYMTLLAAWQVLLHRYSGQDDIVVGSPMANRDNAALEAMIGCFVNNVVMRGRLGSNPSFREFLAQTSATVLAAFDHREVPFDRVVESLKLERSTGHSPVFQAMFTLQSFPVEPVGSSEFRIELLELYEEATEVARFDLTMEIDEPRDGLRVVYEFATDLFDESTIARMHGQFVEVLRQVVAAPELQVRNIALLTDGDRRQLLDDVNATAMAHDRSMCVHQIVAAAAKSLPDAIAVQAADATLTFGQLERRSNQMAQLLRERGVTDGALVGVCLDRIADLPVALLAVMKAGAAYVPVDPAHPAERLVFTLTDAGVCCVITESRFVPLVEASCGQLLLVDDDDGAILAQSSHAPDSAVTPMDLAYVIYTSGSTGRPKGVEVEHRNVVNFLHAMAREPGFGRDDVLVAVTTPSFDIAGLEIFLPLVCGARTVIASRADVLDGEQLIRLLDSSHATVMQATPATWRLMLDAGWTGTSELRVLCGGEAMPRDLARELMPRTNVIWNMYGPTETTIWSTTHRVTDASQEIPIGHAIGNTTVYVLDASGRPAPMGVAGELCIGGEGVARGYRQRPELTAEKFVTVSLEGRAPERVYRTGDVVRLRSDLSLEFVGRRDHQVKVRGYRIELGEIESVLVEHAAVRRAAVIVREDVPGDQRLVAYIVASDGGTTIDAESLRSLLRARLPEYMVPSTLVPLPELPLTPNGKIDRKALPAPSSLRPATQAAADIVMTDPQRRVAAIWREVLRVEQLGVSDNFFDRGGHSLLVVKVHAALRREFQREITLVDLFQHTTIAAQAALVTSDSPDRDASMQRARARAARQVLA